MNELSAPKIICLDANVVLRWLNGPEFPVTMQWIESSMESGSRLVTPQLMRYEVTNALYKSLRGGVISRSTVFHLIDVLLARPIDMLDEPPQQHAALEIATRFRSGATYNAHYVALAQHLGAEFWTADKRLYNAAQPHLDFVRLVDQA